ncbi:MAG: type II toxin-antitoxin system prevent-host-death family antitoxin [Lautropia sp.]|nr:type II toxin-antitoxin system prevent-host-death family antitoxin [Lautropia sp.]
MDRSISAAEANRQFSLLLRNVRDGHRYVITSHGRPVAQVLPIRDDTPPAAPSKKAAFLDRLAARPTIHAEPWRRNDLYDDGTP